MSKLKVEVSSSELRRFRRQAKRLFPREILSVLAGEVSSGLVRVHWISTPPTVGTKESVALTQEDWAEARKLFRKEGLQFLGTIHTHPYNIMVSNSLSSEDVCGAAEIGEKIYAVCTVWRPDGEKFRTHVQWYGGGPNLEVKHT